MRKRIVRWADKPKAERKQCSKCGEVKLKTEFNKSNKASDGLKSQCTKCRAETMTKYARTKAGLIKYIYKRQTNSCKRLGRELPKYTLIELEKWINIQDNFDVLLSNWEESGYEKSKVPSIDRLDDYLPYSLDNIRLVSFKENRDSYYQDAKNGVNIKTSKSVKGVNTSSGKVVYFYSISEAGRKLNISASNIAQVCQKYRETAGGYKWSYYDSKSERMLAHIEWRKKHKFRPLTPDEYQLIYNKI